MGSPNELRYNRPDITEDDVDAVAAVLRSGWITTGGEAQQLEADLAAWLGVEHVVAVASCTAAIEIAVAHLRLPRGSRVGVPTWTFVSTAIAAYHRGLVPVLLDVDEDTFNLSEAAVKRALTEDGGLDAVIGVHFGGVALPRALHELCADAAVPLVEDAAHALGTRDHRGYVAGQGTAGCCYSFYATKNLTSAEGGALATDDAELAAFAQSFRLHGLSRDAWKRYAPGAPASAAQYDVVGDGLKANLPDVLAALARSQLTRFDRMQAARRHLTDRYRERLGAVPGLRLVPAQADPGSADHLMMVLLPGGADRGAVQASMQDDGVGTSVHFRPLHTFGWFREHGLGPGPGGVPVADRSTDRALSLPLYSGMTDADVDQACDALERALTGAA